MRKLIALFFILSFSINAQSQIIFDNVQHNNQIIRTNDNYKDSAGLVSQSSFNFDYLSRAKVAELANYLKVLLTYKNSEGGFNLSYDADLNNPVKPEELRKRLIFKEDSVETIMFSEQGEEYWKFHYNSPHLTA